MEKNNQNKPDLMKSLRLKEFIIKVFTLDEDGLKNQNNILGKDYFEEQLACIRDIRSSERSFNQLFTNLAEYGIVK